MKEGVDGGWLAQKMMRNTPYLHYQTAPTGQNELKYFVVSSDTLSNLSSANIDRAFTPVKNLKL